MGVIGAHGLAAACRAWGRSRPDDPAIVEMDRTWTWASLGAWAGSIAAEVRSGVRLPGDLRVAVEPPMTAAGVAMLHGVAIAGVQAIVIPPRWTPSERTSLLATTRPRLLLSACDEVVGDHGDDVPILDVRGLDGQGREAHTPATGSAPESGAELVVPTSGTTSAPRLARLPIAAIDASAAAWLAVLPAATGWLLSLGLAHVAGIGIVARAAAEGVPVIVTAAGDTLGASLRRPRVSHASLVAAQLHRLLDEPESGPSDGLRCVLLGGGPIPTPLLGRALGLGWPVWPSYGQTETASGVVASAPDDARGWPDRAGRALPGVSLRVRPATGAPSADPAPTVPPADAGLGELEVRGPMVFSGYLEDPGSTLTRLPGDGWLRTGDLAELDADGRVRIVDRLGDLIIVGGENVAPAAVEAALEVVHGVREAAVVGVPDAAWGEAVVAVVVPEAGADPADADLLAATGASLAPFRRPRRILRSAALPRGTAQKLLRRALRGPAADATALGWPSGDTSPRDADSGLEPRVVLADDGQPLCVRAAPRLPGDTRPALLVLHATLSSGAQLLRMAAELAPVARLVLLDRRGSGGSLVARPGPVDVARHVEDAAQVLAACGEPGAIVLGHSFGGVVGLELSARHPGLVAGLMAWEPPYMPLAPTDDRGRLERVAALVARAHAQRGPGAAVRVFMDVVSPGAWERLRPAQQAALEATGDGVLADVAMRGLEPGGLRAIRAPVVLGTGGASEAFYAPIAAAVAARIPGAAVRSIAGLGHSAPIVTPGPIAALVRSLIPPSSVSPPSRQEPAP